MDHSEVLSRAAEGPDIVLRYADHRDGVIDVFAPASLGPPTAPAPLLVMLHGGFWRQGYDRHHVRPLANALIREGWVVAVPEYRRTGGAGGWPQTGDDVRAALETLPGLLADVAPGLIDPNRPVVLAGHSAGGHLALWSGLLAGPTRVSSIVALAAVSDLRYAAEQRLGGGAAQALLGDLADNPEAYDDADPFRGLTAHSVADSSHPAVTLIHGTDDDAVPVRLSRAAATRHPRIDYVELDGVDHFAVIDPLSGAYRDAVLPALRRSVG